MRLVVTGVPGTGKTEITRLLAKRLKCRAVAVNRLVNARKLWKGKGGFGEKIVRMPELGRALKAEMARENIVLEGHLACEFRLPADMVVVLRADPDVLETRLAKRGYPKEKIEENVFAEMLDYCTTYAVENYGEGRVIEFNTTEKSAKESAECILRMLSGSKKRKTIDWSKKLDERLSRPFQQGNQLRRARLR